jgi:Flp pilus assembly protein TadD
LRRRTPGWISRVIAVATLTAGTLCGAALAETESVRALLRQARAQARQDDHARALQLLEIARMMAPNSEDVLSDYARNSLAAKDPVSAMMALEPLTRMHPTVAEYPYLLGVAQLQIKEFAPAIDSLHHSLELEPQRPLTLIALGITHISLKQFAEARNVLHRAVEIEPENAEALAVLAEAEEGLGALELAELHAHRAIKLAGAHSGAYYVLGKLQMSQGRFAEARDSLLRAIESNPDSPRVHYQLSLAYARLGDLENSRKHRELHQTTRDTNEESIAMMRKRAGLKESGMRQ